MSSDQMTRGLEMIAGVAEKDGASGQPGHDEESGDD